MTFTKHIKKLINRQVRQTVKLKLTTYERVEWGIRASYTHMHAHTHLHTHSHTCMHTHTFYNLMTLLNALIDYQSQNVSKQQSSSMFSYCYTLLFIL